MIGLAGDESQRAREIAKALKQAYPSATDAGIAGILGNWMQESLFKTVVPILLLQIFIVSV